LEAAPGAKETWEAAAEEAAAAAGEEATASPAGGGSSFVFFFFLFFLRGVIRVLGLGSTLTQKVKDQWLAFRV